MILFPIALLWIVGVIIWVIRNNVDNEADASGPRDWKRWRPRPPRRPWDSTPGSERRAGSRAANRADKRQEKVRRGP